MLRMVSPNSSLVPMSLYESDQKSSLRVNTSLTAAKLEELNFSRSQAVPDKGNEITREATRLAPTQIARRIVTADAMHTQRTCCADIHHFGG